MKDDSEVVDIKPDTKVEEVDATLPHLKPNSEADVVESKPVVESTAEASEKVAKDVSATLSYRI